MSLPVPIVRALDDAIKVFGFLIYMNGENPVQVLVIQPAHFTETEAMTPAKTLTKSMLDEAKSLLHDTVMECLEDLVVDALISDRAVASSEINVNITLGISAEQISFLASQVPDPMDEYI